MALCQHWRSLQPQPRQHSLRMLGPMEQLSLGHHPEKTLWMPTDADHKAYLVLCRRLHQACHHSVQLRSQDHFLWQLLLLPQQLPAAVAAALFLLPPRADAGRHPKAAQHCCHRPGRSHYQCYA